VVKYSPELEAAFHRRKRPVWLSWRMDETYIKVKGRWYYLYRAVDKAGQTIDFLLREQRDEHAAMHFLCFGRELLESPQVSDDIFNAVRARYGEQGLLELTAVMSVYTMNAAILRVMDHQAAADARQLTPR
jgi:transposase-like protein